MPGITLSPSQINRAFPFHVAIDHELRVLHVGPSLLLAYLEIALGTDIRSHFVQIDPAAAINFSAVAESEYAATWRHKASGLTFRLQSLKATPAHTLLCILTPCPADSGELDALDFLPQDGGPREPIFEMLQLARSQKIALQDERDLVEKLSEQRAQLLQANAELSRQFSLLWDELINLKQIEAETFKIALIANNTDNAVVMTDAMGCVEWVNESFTHMTGYTLQEMLGKTPGSVLQGEKTDPDVVAYTRRQFQNGESFGADILNYSKSGTEYWVQFEVQPIRDEDNKITNWMAIERDITEQKKSELALLEAKKTAEAASRAKSAFLATMSHEIRTPMNAVLGTLNLLLDSPLNDEQALWAKSAYAAAHSLLNIIEDILDFSKIEAGKLTLNQENFDLKSLIAEIIQLFRIRTEAKGLALSYAISPDTPKVILGDPFRLRQILVNLIGNAVKFTEQGEIFVSVFCKEHTATKTLLRFHVKDTGIGIPEDVQASLFSQFVQVDSSATRRYGGTGLGLAICKRLVSLMNGEIGVNSRYGEGSEFWFTAEMAKADDGMIANSSGGNIRKLPNPAPNSRRSHARENPDAPARLNPAPALDRASGAAKILVAEDGEINRMVVTAILGKAGYKVEVAEDGSKAFEAARINDYDLILMDVQMPVMDGYQATSAIRCLSGHKSQVPILAFTANAQQEDRTACLAAGMNDYISKPVDKERLLSTIAAWLNKNMEAEPAQHRPMPEVELAALLDESALRSLADQTDVRTMKETVAIFFADSSSRIEKIEAALREMDYQTIRFEAHSIKSAAITLGAMRLGIA
ncbi:MAG: response regulator, partial [Candidatus Methylumidiphilus sp.]